jgi:UPF0716 protein FxsA
MALLVLLFIVVPIVEIYVIIQVGQAIGPWWTIALLIADSILGSMLMRSQGRAAWRRFNEALAGGRPPAREVFDGVLVIFGGAFLLTPGFVTDIFGLIFLLPPTRALARRFILRSVLRRTPAGRAAMFATRRAENVAWRGRPGDVDGTAQEVESDPPRLP